MRAIGEAAPHRVQADRAATQHASDDGNVQRRGERRDDAPTEDLEPERQDLPHSTKRHAEPRHPAREDRQRDVQGHRAGHVSQDEGPHAIAAVRETERDGNRDDHARGLGHRPSMQMDLLGQQRLRHHAERIQQERDAQHPEQRGESGLGIERSRDVGCEKHERGQERAGADDEPEDAVELLARNLLALDDGRVEPELLEDLDERQDAERHGEQPVVAGGQQPGEDDGDEPQADLHADARHAEPGRRLHGPPP